MSAPLTPALAAVIMSDPWYKKYAKAIISGVGIVLAVVLAFVSPDSLTARIIQAVILVASTFGVTLVPNRDIVGAITTLAGKGLVVRPQLVAGTTDRPTMSQPTNMSTNPTNSTGV